MPQAMIDDLQQRALTTIWELRATRGEIAETLWPYRIRHVENVIEALKAHAENESTPEHGKVAARLAAEELAKQLRYAVDSER
jgi:hypothetical protein